MSKKGLILILLAASWPITCIAKIWAFDAAKVYWFARNDIWDYKNWYAYHLCNMSSYLLIFWAIWIYVNSSIRKDKDVLLLLGITTINQAIDIIHYLLFRRGNAIIAAIEGLLVLYGCVRILLTHYTKKT